MGDLLSVDGLNLRHNGYNIATRTGRYNIPARRGENLIVPGRSGSMFAANKPYEEGFGVLAIWVIGATEAVDSNGNTVISIPATVEGRKQQFETNMQQIMRVFTRPHRLSEVRAEQPDGSIRRARVEWREWSEPEVQAGGTRAEFAIGFSIPEVWWEDEVERSQETVASATLPQVLDLTQFADMTGIIEDGVLTVTGPITDPRITDAETGAWVQYTGTVAAGSSWVIDVKNSTSKIGSTSVMGNTTHAGNYKLLVIPNCNGTTNTPRLTLSGSGATTATKFGISARRKWVHG